MSQNQQVAEVGQIVLQRKEARQKLEQLHVRATQLGRMLQELGSLLERSPEQVKFEGVGFDPNHTGWRGPSFRIPEIDGKQISDLATEIRNSTDEVNRINEKAMRLGL